MLLRSRWSWRLGLLVILTGMVGSLSGTAMGAGRWRPPIEVMVDPGHEVLVARFGEWLSDDRVMWQVVRDLHGEPQDNIAIRIAPEDKKRLVMGEDYVLAFTRYRKNRLLGEGLELDPEGPRIVEIIGVGSAVFPDSSELKRLVRRGSSADPDLHQDLGDLEHLLAVGSPDVQQLAATELYLRPELLELSTAETVAALGSVLEMRATGAELRNLILQLGLELPEPLRPEWLVVESRAVLSSTSVRLELASFEPALVETALEVLLLHGVAPDGELVSPFLGSNSPGVVKAAVGAIRAVECESGLPVARDLLSRDRLHVESKRALEDFVEAGCSEAESASL